MAADFSSLPDHITDQILVKIPCIKSTVTCTSVCKSWYALLKSSPFIEFHLSNPNHNKTEYFLCSYSQKPYVSVQYNDRGTLRTYYDIEFPHNIERVMTIGSVNGLICFKFTTKFDVRPRIIHLWNPSIRKFKALPKPKFYEKDAGYGFWFDKNANDYKVVKINRRKTSKVEVYSLSTNSWNLITTRGPYLGMYDGNKIVHVNGTLYWLWGQFCWKIISFDTKKGKFNENLIWPEEKNKSRFVLLEYEAQNQSLFVLRYDYTSWGKYVICDVWVFDEDLNKIYTIGFEGSETGAFPIGVRNNSSELLFQKDDHQINPLILVCNIEDLKFKDFCLSTRPYICHIRPFVETLVLLNDGDSDWTKDRSK